MKRCTLCDGSGWTWNPEESNISKWTAQDMLSSHVLRRMYNIPEGSPPFACFLCNRTEVEIRMGSQWLPYYPKWEMEPDGDRTLSAEWRKDPRNRLAIVFGRHCKVATDGTLLRVR